MTRLFFELFATAARGAHIVSTRLFLDVHQRRSPRIRLTRGVVFAGAFALTGCHSTKCAPFTAYTNNVLVTATDSATGALVPNISIVAASAHADTATMSIGSDVTKYPAVVSVLGGTYTIYISAPGYSSWSTTLDVASGCGQRELTLTARLQKSP